MENFELDPKNNRRYSAKRTLCSRCCIGCCLCLAIILIVIVGGGYAVTHFMKNSGGSGQNNITQAEDEEVNEFYETWRAPEHIRKAVPHAFIGFDKTGQPVWFIDYGHYDFKSILADESNLEAVDTYRHQSVYRMYKSMRMRTTPGNLSWACLTDMDDYSYSQAFDLTTLSYLQRIAGEYGDFLTTMDYAIVVNVNTFARYFLKAVSVFAGSLMERVHVFGYDKEEWLPFILERIDRDQVPEKYGGYSNFTPIASYFD